jgi:hypothetical protein
MWEKNSALEHKYTSPMPWNIKRDNFVSFNTY